MLSESDEGSHLSASSKTQSKDEDAEREEDQEQDLMKANPGLADDMLAHKAALRKKQADFLAGMDENLSEQQRAEMMKGYEDGMNLLAATIQKEQQDGDMKL